MAKDKVNVPEFFNNLQSVAKLVGDLALSISEAQKELDTNYARTLQSFSDTLGKVLEGRELADDKFTTFFQSMAPSRYQFTETVVEVRADLQMTGSKELQAAVELGYNTPVLATTINASYVKRSAYDYRAAALIRTVLHAVPPDQKVLKTLLENAGKGHSAELPSGGYQGLGSAFSGLLGPAGKPTTPTKPVKPADDADADAADDADDADDADKII